MPQRALAAMCRAVGAAVLRESERRNAIHDSTLPRALAAKTLRSGAAIGCDPTDYEQSRGEEGGRVAEARHWQLAARRERAPLVRREVKHMDSHPHRRRGVSSKRRVR